MNRDRAIALLASAVLLSAALLASVSGAEVSQKSGVRVRVEGTFKPSTLPRHKTAPVSVSVSGEISALSSAKLPQLKALTIAINRAGLLDLKGLPHCRINHINPSTSQQALAMCRSSLIGEGHFSANVLLPEQSPFPSEGRLLAFNGRIARRPAIFAHVYGTEPLSTSFVFAFRVRRHPGKTFGTTLSASFPRATGDWGYITGITLKLNSQFLRASCPAPAGISEVPFPLARTTFEFAGGLTMKNTVTKNCRAAG